MKIISVLGEDEVVVETGWFRKEIFTVFGNGTVWRYLSSGKRVGTPNERALSDAVALWKHKKERTCKSK